MLPIEPFKEDLVDAIGEYQCLIIAGETGSGKTTQIPLFIHERYPKINLAITQPRRIAAISAANRVAYEHGTPLGSTVGYSIRFESKISATTKVKFMTDGVLLRECIQNPELPQYHCVILDEAHERSVETDILLGLLKRSMKLRTNLKVIIMSATLDIEKFVEFFDLCPVFSVPGNIFDIEILWGPHLSNDEMKSTFIQRSIDTVLFIHETEEPGDILVFLTGQYEIENACKGLIESFDSSLPKYKNQLLLITPVYASLDSLDQRAIFEPTPLNHRKVIFATNIAQTSITIPGIRYVVDSGFVKQKSFDSKTAAATQRAGRAGRTMNGKVYRLFSQRTFESMELDTVPEIQRTSLLGTVLSLKKMGIINIIEFDFLDPPDPKLITDAERQLTLLGAIDPETSGLTLLGDQMALFPISPFLSKTLITAMNGYPSCYKQVAKIASMLCVEEVFVLPRSETKQVQAKSIHRTFYHPTGDHLTLLKVFETFENCFNKHEWCLKHFIRYKSMSMAFDIYNQLMDILDSINYKKHEPDHKKQKSELLYNQILECFCSAYFLQVGKRGGFQWYPYSSTKINDMPAVPMIMSPSSALIGTDTDLLEWLIYHDVHYSGRVMMGRVSIIKWEWVEELIKKHSKINELNIDLDHSKESELCVNDLSTQHIPSFHENSIKKNLIGVPKQNETIKPNEEDEASRNNKLNQARERYLSRKRK